MSDWTEPAPRCSAENRQLFLDAFCAGTRCRGCSIDRQIDKPYRPLGLVMPSVGRADRRPSKAGLSARYRTTGIKMKFVPLQRHIIRSAPFEGHAQFCRQSRQTNVIQCRQEFSEWKFPCYDSQS
jgi:hypothetical protein